MLCSTRICGYDGRVSSHSLYWPPSCIRTLADKRCNYYRRLVDEESNLTSSALHSHTQVLHTSLHHPLHCVCAVDHWCVILCCDWYHCSLSFPLTVPLTTVPFCRAALLFFCFLPRRHFHLLECVKSQSNRRFFGY